MVRVYWNENMNDESKLRRVPPAQHSGVVDGYVARGRDILAVVLCDDARLRSVNIADVRYCVEPSARVA